MSNWLLQGKKVLITAGPTREPVDGLLHVTSNTGSKVGFEIAAAMLQQGATVFLVAGPVKVQLEHARLTTVKVNTACEMYMACCRFFEDVDIAVFAAPVSPYRPKAVSVESPGLNTEQLNIKMVKNIDVEAALSAVKSYRQVTVAVHTCNQADIAKSFSTISAKNLDMVVLNNQSLNQESSVLPASITIVKKDGNVIPLSPLMSKADKINDVIEAIASAHQQKTAHNYLKNTELHSLVSISNYVH